MKYISLIRFSLFAGLYFSYTLLCSCSTTTSDSVITTNQSDISWSDSQLSTLKQLWIGSLQKKSDISNKFSDNLVAANFGHKLFFDKNLSSNTNISCASCHQPDKYFTDGLKMAKGISITRRNTPTIISSNHSNWFFHDGRADSLWSQALGPIENAKEQGGNRSAIAHYVYNSPSLRQLYEKAFNAMPDLSDKINYPLNASPVDDPALSKSWAAMSASSQKDITDIFVNIGKALAAYESKIQFGSSRFDQYVESVLNADNKSNLLTKNELSGLKLFISKANCILCHSGPLFTDNEFHNVATVDINNKPYDLGRYNGAKQVMSSPFNCKGQYNDEKKPDCNELKYISLDQHVTLASFKTPGLRSVSKTAPYMHDGQYKDLESVLSHYADPDKLIIGQKDLLSINLSEKDQSDLVAFLKTLDSRINSDNHWLKSP